MPKKKIKAISRSIKTITPKRTLNKWVFGLTSLVAVGAGFAIYQAYANHPGYQWQIKKRVSSGWTYNASIFPDRTDSDVDACIRGGAYATSYVRLEAYQGSTKLASKTSKWSKTSYPVGSTSRYTCISFGVKKDTTVTLKAKVTSGSVWVYFLGYGYD